MAYFQNKFIKKSFENHWCHNCHLHSQLADNVKGNVAAAKAKVEQIARGIDIGDKGTLGDLIFGPDQVTIEPFSNVFSTTIFMFMFLNVS